MTESQSSSPAANDRTLHLALWVAQVVMALPFVGAGFNKIIASSAEMMANMGTDSDSAVLAMRALGACEVAGAIGLILPSALRIQPKLTPLAAALLALIMVGATFIHASKGEWGPTGFTVFLLALGVFIAWGRTKRVPIAPR